MDFAPPSKSFFDFISANLKQDTKSLRLKEHGKSHDFDTDFAIIQIESRRKGAHKLKKFISEPLVLFPSTLSYEQASHESVAAYHAGLVEKGSTIIDMTAGLGIDSMAFARKGCEVTACEMDPLKASVLEYNARILGLSDLKVVNADSTEYIEETTGQFDLIFVDPARRSDSDRRLYNFHDCAPDILGIKDRLLRKCRQLMIKASPLLDITQTLKDIPETRAITAVSVGGECKEVLVDAIPEGHLEKAVAIDLTQDGDINYAFSYNPSATYCMTKYVSSEDLQSGAYLYEPGPAVMKLSPWDALSEKFTDIKKLGVSSHLFVSPSLHKDFPGRILKIESIIDKKSRKSLKGTPANVVTRNYPMKADELRKRLGVKEGDDRFIYATRHGESPVIISATRIRI